MPKRRNPFGDDSPLQIKSRISERHVDLGVRATEKMQAVFERTTAKLFEAARRAGAVTGDKAGEAGEVLRQTMRPLPGQLRFDSSGKLCALSDHSAAQPCTETAFNADKLIEGFFNNNDYSVADANALKDKKKKKRCLQPRRSRPCCQRSKLVNLLHSCTFCDQQLCPECVRTCYECENIFCHLCSLLNYDDCTERAFCLQCVD